MLIHEVKTTEPEPTIIPALALTMGHGIGKRGDLSLDTWMLRTTKGELFALPMLRFSYRLCGKN